MKEEKVPEVKKITIKDRISGLAKKYKIESSMFESDVIEIIERGAFPQNFCEKCQSRMIYDTTRNVLYCINCGASHGKDLKEISEQITKLSKVEPQAQGRKKTNVADKILALKAKIDGVESPQAKTPDPTGDPNLNKQDVNWV